MNKSYWLWLYFGQYIIERKKVNRNGINKQRTSRSL